MTIKILITLNEKKAQKTLNKLNEFDLIEQDKDSVNFLVKEFRGFLKDKDKAMSITNEDCGLTITWCK